MKKKEKEERTPPPAPAPAPDLEEALAKAEAQAAEYLDLARRAKADFLNYQDRARREMDAATKYGIENFVRAFLPVLDALRQSLLSARSSADPSRLLEGLDLIEKEFLRVLGNHGITPIDAAGKPFDPSVHEVAAVVEADGASPNTVVEEIRRGWMLRDRVLRPVLVKIARAAEPKTDAPAKESDVPPEGGRPA